MERHRSSFNCFAHYQTRFLTIRSYEHAHDVSFIANIKTRRSTSHGRFSNDQTSLTRSGAKRRSRSRMKLLEIREVGTWPSAIMLEIRTRFTTISYNLLSIKFPRMKLPPLISYQIPFFIDEQSELNICHYLFKNPISIVFQNSFFLINTFL